MGVKPYVRHKATIRLHLIGKTLSFYQVYNKRTLQTSEQCDLFTDLYNIKGFMTLYQITPQGIVEPNAQLIKLKLKKKEKECQL